MKPKPKRAGKIALATVLICLLAAGAYVGNGELQHFIDNYVLSHASSTMIALSRQSGMSRSGELVFLKTKPQLVSDSEMQAACAQNTAANNENGFIEQGCYSPPTNRIFIRTMPSDLQPLEASTAAYEMLHPVYLSLHHGSTASRLDAAIEANFRSLNDPKLTAQIANFASTEPGARDLELFSLLGTGYPKLTDSLASYYLPCFDNRQATVSITQQVDLRFQQYQNQLDGLKKQIETLNVSAEQAYATSVVRARSGDAAGNDSYYNKYRQFLKQENAVINQYNDILNSYNTLVTEYNGTQPVQQLSPAATHAQ